MLRKPARQIRPGLKNVSSLNCLIFRHWIFSKSQRRSSSYIDVGIAELCSSKGWKDPPYYRNLLKKDQSVRQQTLSFIIWYSRRALRRRACVQSLQADRLHEGCHWKQNFFDKKNPAIKQRGKCQKEENDLYNLICMKYLLNLTLTATSRNWFLLKFFWVAI